MTTTGGSSTGVELLEAVSWLFEKGGIVLLQKTEVHVYCGPVHKCVVPANGLGVEAVVETIRQVRLEHERR